MTHFDTKTPPLKQKKHRINDPSLKSPSTSCHQLRQGIAIFHAVGVYDLMVNHPHRCTVAPVWVFCENSRLSHEKTKKKRQWQWFDCEMVHHFFFPPYICRCFFIISGGDFVFFQLSTVNSSRNHDPKDLNPKQMDVFNLIGSKKNVCLPWDSNHH